MKHLSSGRGNLQISRIGIKDKNSVLRDLELAKKKLSVLPEAVVVAVKNGQVLGSARGHGVQALVNLLFEHESEIGGSAIADKIVGLAPAWLLINFRVAAVFAQVGNRQAEKLLQANHIHTEFEIRVTNILSKDRSRVCPLEQAIAAATNLNEALNILRHHPFVKLP